MAPLGCGAATAAPPLGCDPWLNERGVGRPFRCAMSEENYDSQLRDQGYSPFKLPGARAPAIFCFRSPLAAERSLPQFCAQRA